MRGIFIAHEKIHRLIATRANRLKKRFAITANLKKKKKKEKDQVGGKNGNKKVSKLCFAIIRC